jgi:hypothetical protein
MYKDMQVDFIRVVSRKYQLLSLLEPVPIPLVHPSIRNHTVSVSPLETVAFTVPGNRHGHIPYARVGFGIN